MSKPIVLKARPKVGVNSASRWILLNENPRKWMYVCSSIYEYDLLDESTLTPPDVQEQDLVESRRQYGMLCLSKLVRIVNDPKYSDEKGDATEAILEVEEEIYDLINRTYRFYLASPVTDIVAKPSKTNEARRFGLQLEVEVLMSFVREYQQANNVTAEKGKTIKGSDLVDNKV